MRTYRLVLPADDVLQILDALDSRAESWEYTRRLLNGAENDELRIAEECSDPEEAILTSSFNKLTDLKKKERQEGRMLLLQNAIVISELFGLDKWEYLNDVAR